MSYLIKLKHINLVPYLNMKCEYKEKEDKYIVYILQEFVYGKLIFKKNTQLN